MVLATAVVPHRQAAKFCAINQVHFQLSEVRATWLKEPFLANNKTEGDLPHAVHILIPLWRSMKTR